jgi:HAD superfamily hydrolase (TIGR01509 family)
MDLKSTIAHHILAPDFAGVKMVVFDFDGTLVDWQPNWGLIKKELSDHFRAVYGYDCDFSPLYENIDAITGLFGSGGRKEALRIVEKHELAEVQNAKKIPQSWELIRKLKRSGVKIAIFSSNTRKAIEMVCERLGFANLFETIVTIEGVRKCKPNPDGLVKILLESHVQKEDALFVGNTQSDIEAGRRAGIRTMLVGNLVHPT